MNRTHALTRAEALFVKREKQRTEGAHAMAEYLQKQQSDLANTARLRALRLERDSGASKPGPSKRARAACGQSLTRR